MYLTRPYALDARTPEEAVRELADRAEIVDALHRFGLGQDLRDRELFASAFAEDAVLDFAPAAATWGADSPAMTGRDTIVDTILGMFAGRVDTTHTVTDPRVRVAADRRSAELTALVEAQHLLTADRTRSALLKNRYAVGLVPDDDGTDGSTGTGRSGPRWLVRTMRIDNVWFTGDPRTIFGG